MNSICAMNFFRTTDTTDTTIWKPGFSRVIRKPQVHLTMPQYLKRAPEALFRTTEKAPNLAFVHEALNRVAHDYFLIIFKTNREE